VVIISVKILTQFWEQIPESKTAIQKWAANKTSRLEMF